MVEADSMGTGPCAEPDEDIKALGLGALAVLAQSELASAEELELLDIAWKAVNGEGPDGGRGKGAEGRGCSAPHLEPAVCCLRTPGPSGGRQAACRPGRTPRTADAGQDQGTFQDGVLTPTRNDRATLVAGIVFLLHEVIDAGVTAVGDDRCPGDEGRPGAEKKSDDVGYVIRTPIAA